MKQMCIGGVVILLILLAAFQCVPAQQKPQRLAFYPAVPDEATAVRIAEAVLIPKFGEERVYSERPFVARLSGDVWTVDGTIHPSSPGLIVKGGPAHVQISRDDGRTIMLTHEK